MTGGHHDEQGPGQPLQCEGGGGGGGVAALQRGHPRHEARGNILQGS